MKVNRKVINRYYGAIREAIAYGGVGKEERGGGWFELDESYFGAKRIRGKRGRGAAGKTPVFGLLKRDGKVLVAFVK